MFASSGRLAIWSTACATFSTFIIGSTSTDPLACGTPFCMPEDNSVTALPMSIWPTAMSYFRPSRDADFVRPVTACLVAV